MQGIRTHTGLFARGFIQFSEESIFKLLGTYPNDSCLHVTYSYFMLRTARYTFDMYTCAYLVCRFLTCSIRIKLQRKIFPVHFKMGFIHLFCIRRV